MSGTEGEQRLSQVVKVLSEVASLVALATALLYYFGWRRSEAQARAFGADASVFEMSTQDYVLRSIDVVLLPAVGMLLLALLVLRAHRGLVAGPHVARVGAVLRRSWLLPLVVGVPLLVLAQTWGVLTFPVWFTLAVLGTWYGHWLAHLTGGRRPSFAAVLVLGALVAVSLFWLTERFAGVVGDARADDVKADVGRVLPPASVFSAEPLQLAGTDVVEVTLGGSEGAFRYRYDGLHLLQRSGGKYFLLTGDWTPGNGRLVVLPDDPSVRIEYGPGLQRR